MSGEYRREICDVQLTDLKSERREHYGREREVKDRCCIKDGDKKQDPALQFLWKQDCSRPGRFPHGEEKNETRVLRRLNLRCLLRQCKVLVAGDTLPSVVQNW